MKTAKGVTTLIWNALLCPWSFVFEAEGLVLGTMGLIDLALALSLITGAAMQGRFLPGTYAGCDDAMNWKNGTDGRNFFVAANVTSELGHSAGYSGVCRRITHNWILCIVIIILYLLCAAVNILLGFGVKPPVPDERWETTRARSRIPPRILRPLYRTFNPVQASAWFALRYLSKYWHRRKGYPSRNVRQVNGRKSNQALSRGREDPLVKQVPGPRLPLEILIMIARHLHYPDLVSASRSSKVLRRTLFGDQKPREVLELLRQYSCNGPFPKTTCLVGNGQKCRHASDVQRNVGKRTSGAVREERST
ncbi:hypothetical protein VTI74DRAFT_11272 [Chaetomium olivicolor]